MDSLNSIALEKMPPVLRVRELAQILSITDNTAYALVRTGRIRGVRLRRSYRIPREAVMEYLMDGANAASGIAGVTTPEEQRNE